MSEVVGMDELLRKLDALPSKLGTKKNIIARSLRKGGELVRARMADLAPYESGTLQESIMITVVEQTAEGALARIGPSRKGFYGMFPEFGTVHQSPDPFMRPAFDEKRDQAVKLIGEELARQIERELRRR